MKLKILCNPCGAAWSEAHPEAEFLPGWIETGIQDGDIAILVCPYPPPPNRAVQFETRPCADCGKDVCVARSSRWLLEYAE